MNFQVSPYFNYRKCRWFERLYEEAFGAKTLYINVSRIDRQISNLISIKDLNKN